MHQGVPHELNRDSVLVSLLRVSCLGGGGVKDRPANLGAPPCFVAGVLGADEEVLANGPVDGDRVLGDVGGQRAVGQVEVAIRARVHHGGQFGGGYHQFGEASGASDVTGERDENGRQSSVNGHQLVGEGTPLRSAGA